MCFCSLVQALGHSPTILGGYANDAEGKKHSTILGGIGNYARGSWSTVLGGGKNQVRRFVWTFVSIALLHWPTFNLLERLCSCQVGSNFASVIGGYRNKVNSRFSTIVGGSRNTVKVCIVLGNTLDPTCEIGLNNIFLWTCSGCQKCWYRTPGCRVRASLVCPVTQHR